MSRLDDGFKTVIAFGTSTVSKLYEKEVQPPGVDGGGAIDTTTMRNTLYRTMAAKSLLTLTEHTFEAAYDPAAYTEMIASINVNQLITITFPDNATLAFYGYLDKFVPNAHVEGEQPTATCTIVSTNVDGAGAETAPVYGAAPSA